MREVSGSNTRMPSGIASDGAARSRAPQRQRGRDRVARLTEAATALFFERGFDATTMTEIAARAGASIGSLYLFFPTKPAIAHAILTELADALSARLERLRPALAGKPAADVARAIFDELAAFLAEHPVYPALIDVPGSQAWRDTIRARRREQIAALFAAVDPPLPMGQPERLALIVPPLMRITLTAGPDPAAERAILDELRTMLTRHLEPAPPAG